MYISIMILKTNRSNIMKTFTNTEAMLADIFAEVKAERKPKDSDFVDCSNAEFDEMFNELVGNA